LQYPKKRGLLRHTASDSRYWETLGQHGVPKRDQKLSGERADIVELPSRQRSAVSNGSRLFVQGDGSSAWSRRFRDLAAQHAADLGGLVILSEAQQSLIRRVSAIEVELEQMEGRMSKGEAVCLDGYTRAAGHLRRLLESLGIERRARDVTLGDLRAYLKTKAAAR